MKLYTLTNAAQKLNVCTRTVRRWSEAGYINLVHVGLKVCISSDELKRVMVEGVPAYKVSDAHRAKMRENAKLGRAGLTKKRARAAARARGAADGADPFARPQEEYAASEV